MKIQNDKLHPWLWEDYEAYLEWQDNELKTLEPRYKPTQLGLKLLNEEDS